MSLCIAVCSLFSCLIIFSGPALINKSKSLNKIISISCVVSLLIAVLVNYLFDSLAGEEVISDKLLQLDLIGAALALILGLAAFARLCIAGNKNSLKVKTPVDAGNTSSFTLASHVMKMAVKFEEASMKDYENLAEKCSDGKLSGIFLQLANEEYDHLSRLKSALERHGNKELFHMDVRDTLPPMPSLIHDVAKEDNPTIQQVLDHEFATSEFYSELAKVTQYPAMKHLFASLALEEKRHEAILRGI